MQDMKSVASGDVCVVPKLDAMTGDTLSVTGKVEAAEFRFPNSLYRVAIEPDARGSEGKVYGDEQWKDPKVLSGLSERKIKEEIVQSDGRKVEVDGSKGQFVSEYFRTSCPSYYKRDYFDKMF